MKKKNPKSASRRSKPAARTPKTTTRKSAPRKKSAVRKTTRGKSRRNIIPAAGGALFASDGGNGSVPPASMA